MERESRPPLLAIWLLHAAAHLAPLANRADWRRLWTSRLENLWILAGRGELPIHAPAETVRLCADAVNRAFWLRFEQARVVHWLRGPAAVLAGAMAGLAILAALSRGFQGTRGVIYTFMEWRIEPRNLRYDPRADLVVAHFVPILLAFTIGLVLIAIGRLSIARYGWRYWGYLAAKLVSVFLLLPMIWIEGNAALRAHRVMPEIGLFIGWTAWTLAFLGAFGCAVIWVFTDQRRRCPVCLGLLAMPVTLGSWSSVLEPATTEMLCDEGHGSLAVAENESGADRWIALDSSWRGL